MMENKIDAAALTESWKQLASGINIKRRLDVALFKETFSQTFRLLREYGKETQVEKAHIPLIVEACTFSVTDREQAEAQCNAACVLTERMIHRCLMDKSVTEIPEGVAVYILEERREIYLDFNDVSVALDTLTALMHTRELM